MEIKQIKNQLQKIREKNLWVKFRIKKGRKWRTGEILEINNRTLKILTVENSSDALILYRKVSLPLIKIAEIKEVSPIEGVRRSMESKKIEARKRSWLWTYL